MRADHAECSLLLLGYIKKQNINFAELSKMLIRFTKQSFIILWMQLVMLTKRHYGVLFEIKEEVAILGPSKSPIK